MSGVMPPSHVSEDETPDTNSLLPFVIATIEPANEAAAKIFDEVGQHQKQLHPSLLENIRAELKDYPEKAYPFDDDISDYEPDIVTPKLTYQGDHEVAFRRQPDGKINCSWALGRGASKFGFTRGVTHLIGQPGKDPRGVAARHVNIEIDQDSGKMYLVALDNKHPVTVFVNAEARLLRNGDRHVLDHTRTRFEIGGLQFIFVFRKMDLMEKYHYVLLRNTALDTNGMRRPDGRLDPLPKKVPRPQAGSMVFHPLLGVGAFGTVWAAVDQSTARPWAVKEIHVHKAEILHSLLSELTIYLSYQGQRGLIQAKEISDDRGNTWFPGEAIKMEGFLKTSPFAYKIYVVLPLGVDFWRWSQGKPTFALIVMVFQGVVEGLRILHVDFYLHRDVTTLNMFVLPGPQLHGALGDFGKAILKATSSSEEIGPAATRAPEVDGQTEYGKPADVYSLGFAMTTLLLPEAEHWPTYNRNHRQSKEWLEATYEALEKCAACSEPAAHYSRLLCRMMAIDPADRPCMEEVASEWAQFEGPTLQRSRALPPKTYGQWLEKAKAIEAISSNRALGTRPQGAIERPKFNSFDDMYTSGPQAGGRDQTFQKPKSSTLLNVHAVRATKSTSSLSHKRTVSSVCDATDKSRNTKIAKPKIESETQSITTDADTSVTTLENTSINIITETPETEPAETPESLELKDDLDYLFEEEEQTITIVALTV